MADEKKCVLEKQYIPHKLRSRPLRCIALPAICTLIFIAYWFILCPLIYVITWNDYNNYYKESWVKWWPFAFWGVAFGLFVIIMLIIVLIWRCIKRKEKSAELSARKNEYDTLLTPRNSTMRELYHVSLICDKSVNSKEQLNVSTESLNKSAVDNKRNTIIELTNRLSTIEEKNKNGENNKQEPDKEFTKCSVKKRPDLNLEKTRPLSQVSTISLPRSPLTPRDLFFIDLIEAANSSPAAFIPPTETFLDNERKNYLPEIPSEAPVDHPPVKMESQALKLNSESEYFIANVPDEKSLTAEVFLFVDGGKTEKEFKVTMCNNNDDVFVD